MLAVGAFAAVLALWVWLRAPAAVPAPARRLVAVVGLAAAVAGCWTTAYQLDERNQLRARTRAASAAPVGSLTR